ncbi:hypothetical protein BDB01DRAFT_546022 [Pilobolus umbonatus]|nr:hypothetical protein BDB01DRAFT_546022 [Pilobolus umbonatus]
MVDMSNQTISKVHFLKLVLDQYPTRVGVLTQQVGNPKYAEINFRLGDKNRENIPRDGIRIDDSTTIMPCSAVQNDAEIINIRLSQLPFLEEADLLEGLLKSLSQYGSLVDIGIYLEPITKTYKCTGYASIDIRSRDPKTTFQPLTHVIPWFENSGGSFHAVWKTMVSHCRYCHDEGHVLSDCSKRLANMTCYNCREKGHIAAVFPRDSHSKKQRKTVTLEEGCSSVPGSSPEKHSERQTVTITEECDFSFNKPPQEKHSERKKAPKGDFDCQQ